MIMEKIYSSLRLLHSKIIMGVFLLKSNLLKAWRFKLMEKMSPRSCNKQLPKSEGFLEDSADEAMPSNRDSESYGIYISQYLNDYNHLEVDDLSYELDLSKKEVSNLMSQLRKREIVYKCLEINYDKLKSQFEEMDRVLRFLNIDVGAALEVSNTTELAHLSACDIKRMFPLIDFSVLSAQDQTSTFRSSVENFYSLGNGDERAIKLSNDNILQQANDKYLSNQVFVEARAAIRRSRFLKAKQDQNSLTIDVHDESNKENVQKVDRPSSLDTTPKDMHRYLRNKKKRERKKRNKKNKLLKVL